MKKRIFSTIQKKNEFICLNNERITFRYSYLDRGRKRLSEFTKEAIAEIAGISSNASRTREE